MRKLFKPLETLSMAIYLVKHSIIDKAYRQTPFPQYDEFVTKIRKQKENSIYASASEMYFAAFFGRDSIEAAEDLLRKDPTFARDLIPLLASHQGTQYDLLTEEEPGRIHHEYRMSPQTYYETTGEHLPKNVALIYERLAKMWGGNDRELTYYGSADATPLYIKLIADYIELTDDRSLLQQTYRSKNNIEKTIQESLLEAVEWLTTRIMQGPREDVLSLTKPETKEKRLPLLEYKRYTEAGIPNQMWKDSVTAVIHENGSLPNIDFPIATVELQGHAYDALVKASRILKNDLPKKAKEWQRLATTIQKLVFQKFWLPNKNYFAMAIDRDNKGNYRLVTTPTSDQTELLHTEIFDTISEQERQKFVSGIITTVYDDQFLTAVGIRCRSLAYDQLVDFWDYHGSRAVWIKATYDFVKGLNKQGFYQLADQLKIRILNGIRISGNFDELFYVNANGKVAYDPKGLKKKKKYEEIPATTIPEQMQTWTASAVAAIEYDLNHPIVMQQQKPWQTNLEKQLLKQFPQMKLITSPRKAYKSFPNDYSYVVNIEKGKELEKQFRKRNAAYA